eukprot:evm.model.scf_686.4 EVM.evm.TU.scf_686.4   scf_686:62445-64157(-)
MSLGARAIQRRVLRRFRQAASISRTVTNKWHAAMSMNEWRCLVLAMKKWKAAVQLSRFTAMLYIRRSAILMCQAFGAWCEHATHRRRKNSGWCAAQAHHDARVSQRTLHLWREQAALRRLERAERQTRDEDAAAAHLKEAILARSLRAWRFWHSHSAVPK